MFNVYIQVNESLAIFDLTVFSHLPVYQPLHHALGYLRLEGMEWLK